MENILAPEMPTHHHMTKINQNQNHHDNYQNDQADEINAAVSSTNVMMMIPAASNLPS